MIFAEYIFGAFLGHLIAEWLFTSIERHIEKSRRTK